MISKLHLYRRPYLVSTDPAEYRRYLERHFIDEQQPLYQQVREMASIPHISASVVDPTGYITECCCQQKSTCMHSKGTVVSLVFVCVCVHITSHN